MKIPAPHPWLVAMLVSALMWTPIIYGVRRLLMALLP